MPPSLQDELIHSFQQGDWKNALKLQSVLNESYFLWPKPEEIDLDFISRCVTSLNISTVVSIGCGTGLLEWLLSKATGLKVIGVEIDKNYWTSKYARAHFTDLIFPDDEIFLKTIEGEYTAMMFCYFNDKQAFNDYIKIYKGDCLVIIGPHRSGRHTDPGPFDPDIPSEWSFWKSKEIGNTGDYIAIYNRAH